MNKIIEFFDSPLGRTIFRIFCVALSMLSKNGVIPFDPTVEGVPFHDLVLSGVAIPTSVSFRSLFEKKIA